MPQKKTIIIWQEFEVEILALFPHAYVAWLSQQESHPKLLTLGE